MYTRNKNSCLSSAVEKLFSSGGGLFFKKLHSLEACELIFPVSSLKEVKECTAASKGLLGTTDSTLDRLIYDLIWQGIRGQVQGCRGQVQGCRGQVQGCRGQVQGVRG